MTNEKERNLSRPVIMTLPKIAEEFGLPYPMLYHWAKENRFPYIKSGNRFYVNRDKIIDFLNNGDDREI